MTLGLYGVGDKVKLRSGALVISSEIYEIVEVQQKSATWEPTYYVLAGSDGQEMIRRGTQITLADGSLLKYHR